MEVSEDAWLDHSDLDERVFLTALTALSQSSHDGGRATESQSSSQGGPSSPADCTSSLTEAQLLREGEDEKLGAMATQPLGIINDRKRPGGQQGMTGVAGHTLSTWVLSMLLHN